MEAMSEGRADKGRVAYHVLGQVNAYALCRVMGEGLYGEGVRRRRIVSTSS